MVLEDLQVDAFSWAAWASVWIDRVRFTTITGHPDKAAIKVALMSELYLMRIARELISENVKNELWSAMTLPVGERELKIDRAISLM
ncbi:hypothetical protein NA78x_001800 [Anatilimnocola sp. NA78]|uniref:hypothetical protein n=1 Tax=Anatilimnocola sp. NA78 TaxID=3415683 RepID=UPI003CE49F52